MQSSINIICLSSFEAINHLTALVFRSDKTMEKLPDHNDAIIMGTGEFLV